MKNIERKEIIEMMINHFDCSQDGECEACPFNNLGDCENETVKEFLLAEYEPKDELEKLGYEKRSVDNGQSFIYSQRGYDFFNINLDGQPSITIRQCSVMDDDIKALNNVLGELKNENQTN